MLMERRLTQYGVIPSDQYWRIHEHANMGRREGGARRHGAQFILADVSFSEYSKLLN